MKTRNLSIYVFYKRKGRVGWVVETNPPFFLNVKKNKIPTVDCVGGPFALFLKSPFQINFCQNTHEVFDSTLKKILKS